MSKSKAKINPGLAERQLMIVQVAAAVKDFLGVVRLADVVQIVKLLGWDMRVVLMEREPAKEPAKKKKKA
jgi:hypothetical protein